MASRIHRLDSTRALITTKTCVAIVVGYGLALRFNWNASFVATTIIVLQTAAMGTTLSKAWLRLAGTLVGAFVGLALVATCAHDRELFILAMALLTGVCVWAMQSSTHQYAWLLVVVTAAIVGWPGAANPPNVFQTGVDRVTAVTVGVVLSGLAQAVFWPLTAAAQFERTMRELAEGCRDLLLVVRRGLLDHEMDLAAIDKLESKITSLSLSLDATLQAARIESKRIRTFYDGYRKLGDQFVDLFLATTAISDAGVQCAREPIAAVIAESPDVRQSLDSLDAECIATIKQLLMPRDGSSGPIATDQLPQSDAIAGLRNLDTCESQDSVSACLLSDRILEFRDVAAQVRSDVADVEATASSNRSHTAPQAARPPFRARFGKSALASLQVFLAAWFFIVVDWPLGLQSAMIPVMAVAYLNAQLPIALVASTILVSIASALPLAAVFHFLLMPGTDSFAELAPWLALFFIPYLYGIASRNPLTSMGAMISVLIAKSLISVSTTPPSYDFASFANTYIGMSGGFALVLLLAYLFDNRSPRRGLHKLLAALLSQSADQLKLQGDRSRGTSEGASPSRGQRKQWLQRLGKLKKLSAAVDYRQDPTVGHDQVGTVLRAFDVLVMRMEWVPASGTASESFAGGEEQLVRQVHEWCVESLKATGRALAELEPMAIRPPPNGILESLNAVAVRTSQSRDISEGAGVPGHDTRPLAAYYCSLVDAILDCQNKIESIDWKRWCWDRF